MGRTVDAGENVIIRPSVSADSEKMVTFVQLDDVNAEQLKRLRPAAFLIHETSPGNYQAWLSVSGVTGDAKEFIRRVKKAVGGADKSASGATRLAGTSISRMYAPDFPIVKIIEGMPGRIMTPQKLQEMGLLAEAEPHELPARRHGSVLKHGTHPWPSYDICLTRARKKKDGTPDRSHADISFAMIAITGGHSIEETAAKLEEVSQIAI